VVGVEAEVVVDEVEKVAVMEAAITAALLQEGQITELLSLDCLQPVRGKT
jgi:hypothetical protein